jgi:ATP-dependent DNA helicase RecG
MLDTNQELIDKIRLGEDSTFELKAIYTSGSKVTKPDRKDLSDEIGAFGNTNGGVILLGVDDKTRDVLGIQLQDIDFVETFVREICYDVIKPPINPLIEKKELSDESGNKKFIIKIEISKSLFIHRSANGYFYRVGSSKREMPPEYLARMFQQRSQARLIRFEEQAVPLSTMQDLEERLWKRFIPNVKEDYETWLLKRGLLSKDETNSIRCSVAGLLLCSNHSEKYLPGSYIEAVYYASNTMDANFQLDARKITGSLDSQIEDAMHFFRRNIFIGARKNPDRQDIYSYSERAIFEAIVNAVAHRDYSINGSKIRFFMFEDRIEIYSPGDLPNTLTIDTIEMRQSTRNELISNLLSDCPVKEGSSSLRKHYMEKRGEGVPIIFNESTKISNTKPVYKSLDNSELLLTIFSRKDTY